MTGPYHLPVDYRPNAENRTLETDGIRYWSKRRIRDSLDYQWDVYAYARDLVRSAGLRRVLDVGCGPGTKLMALLAPHCEATGVDQPSVIEWCRRRYPGGRFLSENFERPSGAVPGSFDLIICSDVIEHLVDPDRLLAYLRNLAGPDTRILLSTPCRHRLRGRRSRQPPRPEHIREWAASELTDYLQDRGFVVLESRFLPPVRVAPTALFVRHLAGQWLRGRVFRFNHMVLCRVDTPTP